MPSTITGPGAQRVAVQGHPHDPVVVGRGEVDEHAAVSGEPGRHGDPQQARLTRRLDAGHLADPHRRPPAVPDPQHRPLVPQGHQGRSVRQERQAPRHLEPAGDGDRRRRERRRGRPARGRRRAGRRGRGAGRRGAGHREEAAGGEVRRDRVRRAAGRALRSAARGAGAQREECGGDEECQRAHGPVWPIPSGHACRLPARHRVDRDGRPRRRHRGRPLGHRRRAAAPRRDRAGRAAVHR